MAALPPPPPPPLPPPSFGAQWAEVWESLKKEFISGLLIGAVCLIVALFDQKGTFIGFISDNMTSMPLTVILAGIVGGFGYVMQNKKTGFIASAGKAWLDLIRQFFSLGAGAFWFIQLALFARHEFMGQEAKYSFGQVLTLFLGLVVMAVITTMLEVSGKYAITPKTLLFGSIECFFAVAILIALLRFFDDQAIMCNVGATLSHSIDGSAMTCGPVLLPASSRQANQVSDNPRVPLSK